MGFDASPRLMLPSSLFLETSPLDFSRSGASRGDWPDQFELVLLSSSIGKNTPSPSSSIFFEVRPGLDIVLSNLPIGAGGCLIPGGCWTRPPFDSLDSVLVRYNRAIAWEMPDACA